MHYATLVIVSDDTDLDAAVSEALSNHEGVEWDWWQIGGRWTGIFDGYNPELDSANYEPDPHKPGEVRVKWPTQWKRNLGDVIPVSGLTEEHLKPFHAVAVSGWGYWKSLRYVPWEKPSFQPSPMPPLEWIKEQVGDYFAVVVDCHN